jgi:hypothetical protein
MPSLVDVLQGAVGLEQRAVDAELVDRIDRRVS